MTEMDNKQFIKGRQRPHQSESSLKKEYHKDVGFRPYSLSFDVPFTINIPTDLCNGKSQEDITAWVWKNHQDSIMKALRLECRMPSSVQEEEEKKEGAIPSKKRRSIVEGTAEKKQRDREHLLDTIAYVQRQFFQSESPKVVFGYLLEALLDLMDSEYGFIGEIKHEDDGTMYLQTHAITNIAWNQATRQFYDDNIHAGLRFYNLNTLFGTVMTTNKPVIANNPLSDPRAGGIPDGHPPLNHFLGLPFFNHGKMTGMVGISNKPGGYAEADIDFLEPLTVTCSNLIQAYQQIKHNDYLINTLEESVKARTQELETVNHNLEEANRQVRQNAVMQLQHFACMSHEIRTPLNCIIGMSSLLKDTQMTPMQSESMKMIIASGDLLLAIVNDVLDYAKLETDHVEINVMRSDLQDMLQSILYSIEMKARHQGQSIKAIYDPYLPVFVNTDIRRIQQILFNLLGNAVKFSRPDGIIEFSVQYDKAPKLIDEDETKKTYEGLPPNAITPSIDRPSQPQSPKEGSPSRCPFHRPSESPENEHTSLESSDNDSVDDTHVSSHRMTSLRNRPTCNLIFTVKDYGKGIATDEFEAIFRPFQQASGAQTESVYGGTGLGLAITKKLITAMGGTISVDSDEGCWSKFTVQLPCSDAPAPVKKLTKKMSDATVIIVGLPKSQEDNVLRVLRAFGIDVRLPASVDGIEKLLAPDNNSSSISLHRRVICLIHGEEISQDWLLSALQWPKQYKRVISFFTFGPHVPESKNIPADMSHHVRSLEQIIPQALIEMLDEKCSMSHIIDKNITRASEEKQEDHDVSYENLRVLIAEDNKINQKVLMRMLGRLNIKSIDVVENGRDAVEQEASTPYDVILMDQQMPIMGGVLACRTIVNRATGMHPIPFIIFVTAHVSVDFENECKAAGSSGFLPKPFKVDDIDKCFRNIARKILERGEQRQGDDAR